MKTIILCGGFGTRLSEETMLKPKPMVEVGDRPILWHIMNSYASYGFNDFTLALGYKAEYIKEYFLKFYPLNNNFSINLKDGKMSYLEQNCVDWNVSLIDTGLNTMTGGRLLRLKDFLAEEESFMLTYGDGVSNVDFTELLKFHQKHGKIATVTAVRPPSRFGDMILANDDHNKVTSFREKASSGSGSGSGGGSGWINGGFFIFNKSIFDYLDDGDQTILERSPLEKLANDNELMAFLHQGFWQCMDTLRDKNYLTDCYERGNAPWLKTNYKDYIKENGREHNV